MASVNGAVAIHRAFSLDRSGAIVRRSPACGVGRGAPIGPAPSRTRLGGPPSTSPSTCFQRRICTETGNALLLGDSYWHPRSDSRHHRNAHSSRRLPHYRFVSKTRNSGVRMLVQHAAGAARFRAGFMRRPSRRLYGAPSTSAWTRRLGRAPRSHSHQAARRRSRGVRRTRATTRRSKAVAVCR